MTREENERLGVLETEVSHIKADVTDIKSDVKTLLTNQNNAALALAVKYAAEAANSRGREKTGMWVRFLSERAIAILALGASVLVFLKGGT